VILPVGRRRDALRHTIRKLSAVEKKTFPANVTKIVFGSTRLEFESAFAPSTVMKPIGISV